MGLILGLYLQPFLLFAPAVFIAFSALTSGAVKWRWVALALLPWLVERLSFVLLAPFVADRFTYSFFGRSPIYVLCWISAWLVYLAYWRKFRPAGDATQPHFWPQRIKWVVIGVIALIAARYYAWVARVENPDGPWMLFWAIEIALIVAVVRASPKLPLRIAGAVLVIVLANWIAWFDNAIAEREFAKLCKEQAGMKIYRTVELGAEYFTAEGKYVFIASDGNLDESRFPAEFKFVRIVAKPIDATWVKTRKLAYEVRFASNNELIAQVVTLDGERGGPPGLVENPPVRGSPCPKHFLSSCEEFFSQVFTKSR